MLGSLCLDSRGSVLDHDLSGASRVDEGREDPTPCNSLNPIKNLYKGLSQLH